MCKTSINQERTSQTHHACFFCSNNFYVQSWTHNQIKLIDQGEPCCLVSHLWKRKDACMLVWLFERDKLDCNYATFSKGTPNCWQSRPKYDYSPLSLSTLLDWHCSPSSHHAWLVGMLFVVWLEFNDKLLTIDHFKKIIIIQSKYSVPI